jgi:hypothetical protein
VNKPVVIHRYNQHMGGVDCKDNSVYHTTCSRQTKKYWKKIVYNYMDMAILNAYILYKLSTPQPMSRFQFMSAIAMSLVNNDGNVVHPLGDGDSPDDHDNLQDNAPNLPDNAPNAPVHAPTKVQAKRFCAVCLESGVRSRSFYSCVPCNVGVHPKCYHLLRHYFRGRQGRGRRRLRDSSDSD